MRPINDEGAPAIWIYPSKSGEFVVKLTFKGAGFMTTASPDYNDAWRVHVDADAPFYRYSSLFGDKTKGAFLDYDGFRAGDFQTESGWCVAQKDLFEWQRTYLRELGFLESEVDDANYTYGRRLLERRYKEPLFAIYPQPTAIVDTSVGLEVTPTPDSTYRLWLYFVPVAAPPENLKTPKLDKVSRKGLTVVELAYLTDREIPTDKRRLFASRPGREVHACNK
jgi:hypothetical protein